MDNNELCDNLFVNKAGNLIYVDRNHYNYHNYSVYKVLGFTEQGWFLLSSKLD